eukprot:365436-Chlamydomonas_euryale.AAC.16
MPARLPRVMPLPLLQDKVARRTEVVRRQAVPVRLSMRGSGARAAALVAAAAPPPGRPPAREDASAALSRQARHAAARRTSLGRGGSWGPFQLRCCTARPPLAPPPSPPPLLLLPALPPSLLLPLLLLLDAAKQRRARAATSHACAVIAGATRKLPLARYSTHAASESGTGAQRVWSRVSRTERGGEAPHNSRCTSTRPCDMGGASQERPEAFERPTACMHARQAVAPVIPGCMQQRATTGQDARAVTKRRAHARM